MKKSSLLLSAILLLVLSSCGKIPSAYRGSYVDVASGSTLQIGASDGSYSGREGDVLKANATELDYNALAQGKPGIYTVQNPNDANELEIFWVAPNVATRNENSNFIWMQSEVLYTRMRTDLKDPVQSLEFMHCKKGSLMVDLPSKTWNAGCPWDAEHLMFKRYQPKK